MYKYITTIANIAAFCVLSAGLLEAKHPTSRANNSSHCALNNPCGKKQKTKKAKKAKRAKVSKKNTKKSALDTRAVMAEVYDCKSGFGIPANETRCIEEKGGAPTYGEIKLDSLATILNDFNITKKDVLYDLGSGIGKVVVQGYLEFPFKKTVGVELSEKRHGLAMQVLNDLKDRGALDKKRTIDFILGDFVETPFKDATVVYLCSTCYSNELMTKLAEKFALLKKGARIITLKHIPSPEKYKLEFTKEYRLPMTWSGPEGSPVYIYEKIK